MIVKNEARCLARCLKSVQPIVQELIIVDTGSTDDTPRIAREFKADIHQFGWVDDFSAARNFALEKTTGDWILVLDADEYASEALLQSISVFLQGDKAVGRLKIVSDFRRNNLLLRSQGFVSRLFPRGARFEGAIHEQLVTPLPKLNLRGELWHDGYLETAKTDRNIRLLLKELERQPDRAYYLFQLALEYSSLNRTQEAFACLQKARSLIRQDDAFAPNVIVDYLYAINELRQFELGLKTIAETGDFLDDFPDYHFVCGLFFMNLVRSDTAKYVSYLPRIEQCYKRCLALGESDSRKSVHGTGSFLALFNLGTLYHVFGDTAGALDCFGKAARLGHEPSREMLVKLGRPGGA
jgi:glycosyltransferase involved in cell wall biosynthesis